MTKLMWEKKGLLFDPTKYRTEWMFNYAQNPNVLELEDRIRVYFTTRPARDKNGNCISNTAYADFTKEEPFKLIGISERPLLEFGGPGDFDEFGIMPGSLVKIPERNEVWLYYVGWTRLTSVPYKWSVGLAISKDNGKTFEKFSKGPVISSSAQDPYLQACPRVIRLDKDNLFMWYNSGTEWNYIDGHYESVYITKTASSKNGIDWVLSNKQVIPSKVEKECQTSASYFEYNNMHHILFSYRYGAGFRGKEKGYRIGYMWSKNLKEWHRDDKLGGIDVSDTGWDSEMVCYPHAVKINNEIYMFYCGNNFGENGFGYTKLLNSNKDL